MPIVKSNPLSYEQVFAKIDYNPDTGVFVWKVDASKNIKAGTQAGCMKGLRTNRKTGKQVRYMYIRVDNFEFPAARIAWLLAYKEWPKSHVLFDDNDPSNLKISNLRMGKTSYVISDENGKKSRKMIREVQHNYGLKRYYGIDLGTYQEMLLAQNGVCAICGKPETSVVNGKIKPLAVDHCHDSTKIRGLLCARCNQAIGLMGEDTAILHRAIDYLNKHQNPVNLDAGSETA